MRSYYIAAFLIILLCVVLFLLQYEKKKPKTRELALLVALTSIAVLSRSVFFMLPQFKPVTAFVILSAVILGAESGCLMGAATAFVSNFFFGQGPWTPWQMFAWGSIGLLTGFLFSPAFTAKKHGRLLLCIYGFFVTVLLYGGVMDTQSMLFTLAGFDVKSALGFYLTGLPMNVIHGGATALFIWLLYDLYLKKLERIVAKYGIRIKKH